MKSRHVLWPVVVLGAFSLVGACSDGGSTTDGGNLGGESAGGGDGKGASSSTGASSSMGASSNTGGMGEPEGGSTSTVGGGDTGPVGGSSGVGGAGVDLCEGLDLSCEDDDNPCTEDECNPETGECGIPRSETACDDGLYCNGEDMCVEGECTAGTDDPCGGRTCNEAQNACECTMDEHCPADIPGEWGECQYANVCVETGERTRPITTFTCTQGVCVQGAVVAEEPCPRETDGNECPSDNLFCNGVESCKNGNCTGAGTPCSGATPFCAEASDKCNECANNTHCAGGEECCKGVCQPEAETCSIIVNPTVIGPTVGPTVIGTLAP